SLYFVAVSSSGEPEVVLRQQLEFVHNQILFILTSQIQDILKANPSRDIRELMGSDTSRLIDATCKANVTPPYIVFSSLRGFSLDTGLRYQLLHQLKCSLRGANAAFGCILFEDSLLCFATNDAMEVVVDVADILLLTQFVKHSSSLRSHDENCVPICLPSLNDRGFVQAYIASLGSLESSERSASYLSLVLISAGAADAGDFKKMHDARVSLQEAVCVEPFYSQLRRAMSAQDTVCRPYLSSILCSHFFYKFTPSCGTIPAQCIWSGEESAGQHESGSNEMSSRIWTYCYRLAVCLREGSSSPECTLLTSDRKETSPQRSKISGNSLVQHPAADHALAYAVTEEGTTVVGLATSDSELYAAFPSTVSALDGCGLANYLTRLLRKDSDTLFHVL
ncbi:apg-13, partial [Symbiodinium microadriaticum]